SAPGEPIVGVRIQRAALLIGSNGHMPRSPVGSAILLGLSSDVAVREEPGRSAGEALACAFAGISVTGPRMLDTRSGWGRTGPGAGSKGGFAVSSVLR